MIMSTSFFFNRR